ncbi:MAG: sigma-70 family RNA polymerase sigma factor [Enhygromyxa sp.]
MPRAERHADAERLTKARAGDDRALVELYERHVEGLWAFVFYRVGRDPALCEDVVQETFLVALEREALADDGLDRLGRLARFDPERGSFGGWLCGLARNVIRRQLRAVRRGHELGELWERIDATLVQTFSNLDKAPLGDELLAREETRDLVQMTIANLPDDYRDALERKYVRGESLRELAAAHECSESAAKSMLARARRAFKEAFAALAQSFGEEELRDVRA